jgi:hypothetical protein
MNWEEKKKAIKAYWKDPKNTYSFAGIAGVKRGLLLEKNIDVTLNEVRDALKEEPDYLQHIISNFISNIIETVIIFQFIFQENADFQGAISIRSLGSSKLLRPIWEYFNRNNLTGKLLDIFYL